MKHIFLPKESVKQFFCFAMQIRWDAMPPDGDTWEPLCNLESAVAQEKVQEYKDNRTQDMQASLVLVFCYVSGHNRSIPCALFLQITTKAKVGNSPGSRSDATVSSDTNCAAEEIRHPLRSQRSSVWAYFSGKYTGTCARSLAECKLCKKVLSACNTTNLKAHLTSVHRHQYVTDRIKDEKVCTSPDLASVHMYY